MLQGVMPRLPTQFLAVIHFRAPIIAGCIESGFCGLGLGAIFAGALNAPQVALSLPLDAG